MLNLSISQNRNHSTYEIHGNNFDQVMKSLDDLIEFLSKTCQFYVNHNHLIVLNLSDLSREDKFQIRSTIERDFKPWVQFD